MGKIEDMTSTQMMMLLKCATTMQVNHYGKIEDLDVRQKWEMDHLEKAIQKLEKAYFAKVKEEDQLTRMSLTEGSDDPFGGRSAGS